jgi:hypothetical protein
MASDKTQFDKFKDVARERDADEGEKRWGERLKRIAKAKDVPVPPPRGPLRQKPGKPE